MYFVLFEKFKKSIKDEWETKEIVIKIATTVQGIAI